MAAEQEQQNPQSNGIGINTFTGGLNQDLAKTVYKPGNYLDALNITLLTDSGLSTAVVQNKKGTKLQIQFPATIPAATYETNGEYPQYVPEQENIQAIEGVAMTNGSGVQTLFFFTKSNTVGDLNDNGYGQIWRCQFLGTTDNINGTTNGYQLTVNNHLMYNRDLNFKYVERIKALAKYENQNFARIYWTDGINPVRSINTVGPLSTVIQIPVRSLNIVAEVNLDTPVIKRLIKGSLPEGRYQLAYRLLSDSGDLTNFSSCSNLIDVIEGYEFNSELDYPIADTIDISSDITPTTDIKELMDSQKGIEFYIPHIDKDYQMIQYALIYYSQPNLPEIFVYPYKEISLYTNQNESFTNLYGDTTLLTIEEFNIMYAPFEKAQTIEIKDNTLFVANTTNDLFKVNVDYRAYRYNPAGQCTTYELDGTYNVFTGNNYPANTELDVINPYNDESGTVYGLYPSGNTTYWFNNQQYKYIQDGITLGGQGPNISYTFNTNELVVDSDVSLPVNKSPLIKTEVDKNNLPQNVPNHVTNNNGSFSSLKSPYKASCQVSWQRGEVYRFGITFYNKKGQASYVNWIGDIKMPDFNETSNTTAMLSYYSSGKLKMYSTYVDFNVTIPQELAEEISGFRIVYVEREENDKTRFGTGITGGLNEFKRLNIDSLDKTQIITVITATFCLIVNKFIDDIDGNDDLFGIKDNLREKVVQNLALTLLRRLYTLDIPVNKFTNLNDFSDFVETVLDGAVNKDSGTKSGAIIKVIFSKTIDKIKNSVVEEFRKTLAKKVAGIHENVLALGQRGFANSIMNTQQGNGNIGYVISPIVDFNKYNFKQGDYLKPINIFNANNKILNQVHRDTSVGLYNILDASAYLRKWYKGTPITWNESADSDLRRIYIKSEKVLQPGELLGASYDSLLTGSVGSGGSELGFVVSNSYISIIPQSSPRGQILESGNIIGEVFADLIFASQKYNSSNTLPTYAPQPISIDPQVAADLLKDLIRPHFVLGIGDKKHFIIANPTWNGNGVPLSPAHFPAPYIQDYENYGDNESYLTKLFYGQTNPTTENQECIRKIDYDGDYTVSYNRAISINQYGGVGFSSRANNEYIPASEYYSLTSRVGDKSYNIKANLGDTYIGVYGAIDYAYFYNQIKPDGYQNPIRTKKGMYNIFPCEASFNFTLREGEHLINSLSLDDLSEFSSNKTDPEPTDIKKSKLFKIIKGASKVVRFTSRLQMGGATNLLVKRNVNKRMINDGPDTAKSILKSNRFLLSEFKYNDVFHQKYNIQKYFPPSLFYQNEVDQYTNRIWNSKAKIDGEVIDSWRNFQFVDYLDVEGVQGPIVELVVNKNKIFYYQTNGIGIASSNERGAVQGSDGSIVLTNNKVLLRYDYITKETGTSHQYSVINTNSSIYHYDNNLKKIFQLGDSNPFQGKSGLECISDNLGLFSKLQSVNNNINKSYNGIHGIYDTEYQTVYYTFLDPVDSNNSFTLGYNEKLNAFESFYSFKPKTYFKLNTMVFGSMGNNQCYWHNKGDYGSFYGTVYPSKIKVLTNDAPLTTKVWDNQKFQTQVYRANGTLLNDETFHYILS